jgi:hypothetical protein
VNLNNQGGAQAMATRIGGRCRYSPG